MPVMFSHPIGGALPSGDAGVTFASGDQGPTVFPDSRVQWDFDGDGDFDQADEDVTGFVVDVDTLAGRDWPSQLTGKAGPGQLKLTLRNDDDRFSYFNAGSPLNAAPNSLDVGRKIRVRVVAERTLDLPGSGGAHASTPDAAALDLTGDQTLSAEFVPDSLTVIQTLVAKFDATGNQRSIMLQVDTSGRPRLIWSTDGTLAAQVIATCGASMGSRRRQCVWAALQVNDGGVWRVRFYTASRWVDPPVLLATISGGATTSVFASTTPLRVGAHGSGSTEPFAGYVYRAGYAAGLITSTDYRARPDFTKLAAGTTSFSDGIRTWTLNGTAAVVDDPAENQGDPALLARDRFAGPVGPLSVDELGTPWVARTAPLRTFGVTRDSAGATMAEPDLQGNSSTASIHIATVDIGQSDFYAQIRWRFLDQENDLGIVYRWTDNNNYGVALVGAVVSGTVNVGMVSLAFVSGGSFFTTTFREIELRNDDILGLLVVGNTGTVLHNGVPWIEGAAVQSLSTAVGLYADWNVQRPPACQEFYVWDGLPDRQAGTLWTGDVTDVRPHSPVGGPKTVEVTAEGRLSRAAGTDITTPNSIGPTDPNTPGNITNLGSSTGELVGSVLGRIGLIHPPGVVDQGELRVGGTELGPGKALDGLRAYEEAELGFVHESPEGYVDFDARFRRAEAVGTTVWGDSSSLAQFQFSAIELLDWRREIVNRVESGLSPKLARVVGFQGENTAAADVIIPMPTTANGADPGDLFLIIIACSIVQAGTNWITPEGWTEYRDAKDITGRLRIYAKVAEDDDIGDSVRFLDTAGSGDFTSWNLLVKNFYGDLGQGLAVSTVHGFGGSSVARARAGQNRPQAVFPPWAPAPTVVLSIRAGMVGGAIDNDENEDEFYAPNGFASVSSAASATLDTGLQMAFRNTNESVIQPSPWLNDPAGAGFQLYDNVETVTIAIRGFAGNPPETKGGQTIVADDFASQTARGGLIRTHENPSRMFATVADADAYNAVVLAQFGNDRPLFRIEWPATKSALYREQAYTRRVGDRIRLVASTESGMGVDADFFIESIAHRIDEGGYRWVVSWELSPA